MKNITVCLKKYRIKIDGIKGESYRKDRGSFDKYGPKNTRLIWLLNSYLPL